MAAHAYTIRENSGGNFCGHSPFAPRFALAKPVKVGKGGIPRVLTLCMERVTAYYHRPDKTLPSLNLANGSERQQRSERREACICLTAALLKFTDVVSLRVGFQTPEGFVNLTVRLLAQHTGMHLKRVERALRDLKAAGLVTVSQPRQLNEDGSWRGLAAVKTISKHLFGAFGLGEMLAIERKKASKRLREKALSQENTAKPVSRTGKARFNLFLGALAAESGKGKPGKTRKGFGDPPGNLEFKKQQSLRALELKQSHPDWSSEKCHYEASKQLSGRR